MYGHEPCQGDEGCRDQGERGFHDVINKIRCNIIRKLKMNHNFILLAQTGATILYSQSYSY